MYATTARPDLAKALGFVGAKIPLPYGPGDGDEGMRKNIERIKQASARGGVGVNGICWLVMGWLRSKHRRCWCCWSGARSRRHRLPPDDRLLHVPDCSLHR